MNQFKIRALHITLFLTIKGSMSHGISFKLNQQMNFKGNRFYKKRKMQEYSKYVLRLYWRKPLSSGRGKIWFDFWKYPCKIHTFNAVRRGIGNLRWDSAGISGVLSGSWVWPRLWWPNYVWLKNMWLHLSWSTKECLSDCGVWMWVWMSLFFILFFWSCDYPLQRGGWHLYGSAKSEVKKKPSKILFKFFSLF